MPGRHLLLNNFGDRRGLHSFPTRRSSDLQVGVAQTGGGVPDEHLARPRVGQLDALDQLEGPDRKSTRLNSSHVAISYAGFCLKKKTFMAKHIINSSI